jgi:hypothetical protein
LDQTPQGYADFDRGAARQFVIDPHGLLACKRSQTDRRNERMTNDSVHEHSPSFRVAYRKDLHRINATRAAPETNVAVVTIEIYAIGIRYQ